MDYRSKWTINHGMDEARNWNAVCIQLPEAGKVRFLAYHGSSARTECKGLKQDQGRSQVIHTLFIWPVYLPPVAYLTDNHRWKECLTMDEKTKILISLGASTAANCVPCLEHYYGKAYEVGLTAKEMEEAAEIGVKVKRGADLLLRKSLEDLTAGEATDESPCCCLQDACPPDVSGVGTIPELRLRRWLHLFRESES